MKIERVPVTNSSSVEEYAYLVGSGATDGVHIAVRFKGTPSRWYVYNGCTGSDLAGMRTAPSIGSYVANVIKRKYDHEIVEGINGLTIRDLGYLGRDPAWIHTSERAGRFA